MPKRARGSRYGVADMHSVPPASTTSFSPAAIESAPSVIALSDEAQALLTVKAGTASGTPGAVRDLARGVRPAAGLPRVAEDRLVHGRRRKARALDAPPAPRPRRGPPASSAAKAPPNLPIGVRAAERT